MTERFAALPTDAEERWLAGQGPEPVAPADRLPERAGVLVPRAGGPSWSVPARRDRVRVEDGDLVFRRDGRVLRRVAAGTVRRLVWLTPGAVPRTVRWVPAALGHVLVDADQPAVFRVDDWLPGDLVGRASEALRAAGFEGLARELGVPLDVVSTPGAVPLPSWRTSVRPWRGRVWATACIASFVAGLAGGFALLLADRPGAAAVTAAGLFLLPAVLDHVALRLTRRSAWAAATATGRLAATTAAAVGVHGTEVVLAERGGWQCWLAGPELGGVSSLVVARAAAGADPWGSSCSTATSGCWLRCRPPAGCPVAGPLHSTGRSARPAACG